MRSTYGTPSRTRLKHSIAFYLLPLVLFCACNTQRVKPAAEPRVAKKRTAPTAQIEFSIVRHHDPDAAATDADLIELQIATTKIYKCSNYFIPLFVHETPDTVVVKCDTPRLPNSACLTAFGPARGRAALTEVSNGFVLRIDWLGTIDEYQISADYATVTPVSAKVSKFAAAVAGG